MVYPLTMSSGAFYRNVALVAKTLTVSSIKNVFGFTDS